MASLPDSSCSSWTEPPTSSLTPSISGHRATSASTGRWKETVEAQTTSPPRGMCRWREGQRRRAQQGEAMELQFTYRSRHPAYTSGFSLSLQRQDCTTSCWSRVTALKYDHAASHLALEDPSCHYVLLRLSPLPIDLIQHVLLSMLLSASIFLPCCLKMIRKSTGDNSYRMLCRLFQARRSRKWFFCIRSRCID